MTSEGQQAGRRPGATSGGGDSFPAGHVPAGRSAPPIRPSYPHAQESIPSAYGPPPQATPNGGSPFVVPAVPPGRSGRAQGPLRPRRRTVRLGRLRPAHPTLRPPLRNPSDLPSRSAHPTCRRVAPSPSLPSRGAQRRSPEEAQSVWAPPPAQPHQPSQGGLPQRSPGVAGGPLAGPVGEFNGFTPARSASATPPADFPRRLPAADDQQPAVSAFGDQRVRVPGATLTDLPDRVQAAVGRPKPPAFPYAARPPKAQASRSAAAPRATPGLRRPGRPRSVGAGTALPRPGPVRPHRRGASPAPRPAHARVIFRRVPAVIARRA